MNSPGCCQFTTCSSRRDFLRYSSTGFGLLALTDLLAKSAEGDPATAADGLALRPPHFEPRARRVIFLFMHGGPSQVDTFDYKPQLQRDDGKPLPFAKPRIVSSPTGNLLSSPFRFAQHGESGAWVSELFPNIARHVDQICFIHSMFGTNSRHGAAALELHTGSDTFVRPSMGSWVNYGLGSENHNLPGYVTICPTLTHGGLNNWSSAFLPAAYQGTPMGNAATASADARIPFVENHHTPPHLQRMELDFLSQIHRRDASAEDRPVDHELESRIQSFELAFRMQMEAPSIQDVSDETSATRRSYGLDDEVTKDFGLQCLLARRFAEAGVRFIQVSHSYKWDQHTELRAMHRSNAAEVDQPIAALLKDLSQRGLLDDTLVLWCGEFGRTPVSEGNDGRDHNPHGFTAWMAGGGVRPGMRYGATDEYGYFAAEDKVHFHDLHATMLHLLGLDHERLTYRYAGRDFRLTDVHGRVVEKIIS